MKDTDEAAQVIWNYHVLDTEISKSDCILALGNSDIRTAEKAAELFLGGFGDILITTGGLGRLTKDVFFKPEAQVFAERAEDLGVPREKILIEDKSTNTFDNLRFTRRHLDDKNIYADTFIVVTKPYMERRASAMFSKIWPDKRVVVTSPKLSFTEYPNDIISKELTINMIVGDLQRIIVYGGRGDIEKQEVPNRVQEAYEYLVEQGYDKQLISESDLPVNH